jgi:predicted nucleotidyltransferase
MKTVPADLLDRITDLAEHYENLSVVWLYGSRAKGTSQADSDYDLAVAFNTFPEDEWDKRLQPEELKSDWSATLGTDKISIIDINNIPLPLAYSVIQQGRVLYCKDPLRLSREELRIGSMWEVDYQWHKKNYG